MKQFLYPFSAIVEQKALKTALLLNAVDPSIGGLLIQGHKGTGKSTAAEALAQLLPDIEVSKNYERGDTPLKLSKLGNLLTSLLALQLLFAGIPVSAQSDLAVEQRIIDYLKKNVAAGKPLVVSELYNNVFTAPEERKSLDRLFNIFFKIPIFVAQYKAGTNRIPTLADIARQFNLPILGEVQILLAIMDSDPRIPKFITRDPGSGEITGVDIEAVKKDKRFNQAIERTIGGWERKPAPAFTMDLLNGKQLDAASLTGKNYLIYFWFSGCPPCVQLAPHLVRLEQQFGAKNFRILAVNADRFLELDTTDAQRAAYVKKLGFRYPVAHLNKKMYEDYGSINIYPTLFLVDSQGIIRKHYIGHQSPEVLTADIKSLL